MLLRPFHLHLALPVKGASISLVAGLNEAGVIDMCMGDAILLELIKKELIVGNRLGQVPEIFPRYVQEDFEQQIKSLRLKIDC
jgi:hypothetical protein